MNNKFTMITRYNNEYYIGSRPLLVNNINDGIVLQYIRDIDFMHKHQIGDKIKFQVIQYSNKIPYHDIYQNINSHNVIFEHSITIKDLDDSDEYKLVNKNNMMYIYHYENDNVSFDFKLRVKDEGMYITHPLIKIPCLK